MKILGLIPARGGSKGIPAKNVIEVAGRPLLAYTCQAALDSKRLTHVLVNTDSRAIADIAQDLGVEVPFLRPDELAQDDTPILPVIRHALEWLAEHRTQTFDAVMLLQPTSPLRRTEHIDRAVEIMVERDADTVVSVVEVPHNFNPVSLMKLDDRGRLSNYEDGPMILRRQDKPHLLARNGPAVLLTRTEVIQAGSLYGEVIYPLLMDRIASLDIDEPVDLELAEFFLGRVEQD